MLKINFHRPLPTLEIRDPAFAACQEVAREFELFATFNQPQQPALSGPSYERGRKRIGNGKHKNWYIDFQVDEPQVSRPKVVGRVALKTHYDPGSMQYGGFDYGKYGEPAPQYNFITVHTPSELGVSFMPKDPSAELLAMIYQGLEGIFVEPYPRLFDIDPFDTIATIPQARA